MTNAMERCSKREVASVRIREIWFEARVLVWGDLMREISPGGEGRVLANDAALYDAAS